LPLLNSLRVDTQALAWTLLVAIFTAMIFGLLPGLRVAGGNLQEVLKDAGPGAGLGRKHERLRATLVVSEVALACMLLISAGLLFRSFLKVLDVDLGFQPDRAASINVRLRRQRSYRRRKPNQARRHFPADSRSHGRRARGRSRRHGRYLPLGPNRSWDTPVPRGKTYAPGEVPDHWSMS